VTHDGVAPGSSGALTLVVPALAHYEAGSALTGKHRSRNLLVTNLRNELKQLLRSKEFSHLQGTADALLGDLARSVNQQETELHRLRRELISVACTLPCDEAVLRAADEWLDRGAPEDLPDAMILAAILRDPELDSGPSCFVTTNSKDFQDPSIKDELGERGCKLMFKFEDALAWARAKL